MKKIFSIKGMHCNSCAQLIEAELKNKVNNIKVSYANEKAEIDFDDKKISESEIKKIIESHGYECNCENSDNCENFKNTDDKFKTKKNYFAWAVFLTSAVLLLITIYYYFGDFFSGVNLSLPEVGANTSLILLFLAGLSTGFHCIAMCGGFLVSYTAKNAINGHKSFYQHLVYGGSKTISYTIIGALFGLVGSIFVFSPLLRGSIAIFAGVFMLFYSLSMFGFGFFKKFQFNPKFLSKISSKKYSGVYFGPMMTGLLNGLFIACGPLQALYLYAAGTGSFVEGGLSLMVFGLGTLPVMLIFGGVANILSHTATKKILKISAIIVLVLGLIMLNRGLALTGTGYDFASLKSKLTSSSTNEIVLENGYQIIKMDVTAKGWSPNKFVLQKDVPVKWIINGKEITGCNKAIQVPSLNLKFNIKKGEQTIEFTPTKEGVISWSCWMGMIQGTFIVTEDGTATSEQLSKASPKTSGSCGCGSGCGGGCGGGTGGSCGVPTTN